MSETSRRTLIAVTGAGAAAGAVTLATGGSASAAPKPGRAQEPVVVHIEDHAADTLRLYVGEREVVVRDRDLVTRILNAAGGN